MQGWSWRMEGGHALADVLLGNISPSGKLPFTFPMRLEDSPAIALGLYPQKDPAEGDLFSTQYRRDRKEGNMQRRERPSPDALYTEGWKVGYRWYDDQDIRPLYAFGHGLSYVEFAYSDLKTDRKTYQHGDMIKVSLTIANKGAMTADEVAQIYVSRPDSPMDRPLKELKGFSRVIVDPESPAHVSILIPVDELRDWDTEDNCWKLEPGKVVLSVGSASDDIRLTTAISLK